MAADAVSSFDFLAGDDAPQRMPIVHPANGLPIRCVDGEEAFILVHSISSTKGIELQRAAYARAQRQGRRAKPGALPDFDDAVDQLAENAARLTAGWRLVNPSTGEVQDIEWSVAKAKELFLNGRLDWLRRQVDEFASEPGNFMQA